MKKILFATTALVVTAGAAAADITLSGSANMGVKYQEGRAAGETFLYNELDFGINASSTTDSGIEFGASIDLDASMTDDTATQDPGSFDPEVYISSGGLTLTVGTVDPATDPFGIGDIGFDGIGIDDVGEKIGGTGVKGNANVIVEYTMGDYSFAASADGNSGDDWAIAFMGSFSGLDFGIGYNEAAVLGTTVDATWLDLSYGFGDVTVGAFYLHADAAGGGEADNYGFEAAYTAGDLTVNFAYSYDDSTDADAYGVGASYNLGSGLAVAGGVGDVDGTTVADFGVTMSF
ncbi:porin [Oceanicola sp. S124]|uniref:porin n=1 Tax=Oceanicola sp. S124 TaxID=1042378 RepID=UPI00025589D0|nr:porin [Oceanicola sp. S124]